MLLVAAVLFPISATRFIDTARPALSSAGEVILEPEDKRERDALKAVDDFCSKDAVESADVFVLITITLSVSRPVRGIDFLRGVHAAGEPFQGRFHHEFKPCQLFQAADRLFLLRLSYRREPLELENK
jgi:hypothetical protein